MDTYEKKYKETLAKAKKELDACGSQDCDTAKQIFRFFPELKESEDEKIRKALISFLKSPFVNENITDEKVNPWIAWLEKQGEKDEEILILKDQIESLHAAIKTIKETYKIEQKKQYEQKLAEEYNITGIHSKHAEGKLGEMINRKLEMEKQGEQKPVISYDALKEGIRHFGITQYQIDNWLKKYVNVGKQGEKKPANNVKPKFNVGQTIKKKDFNLRFPIVKIEDGFYYNDMGDNFPFTDQDNWELIDNFSWNEDDEKDYTDSFPKDNWEYIQEFIEKFGHFPKDCDELDVLINYVLSRKQKFTLSEDDKKKLSECYSIIKQWQDKQDDYYYEGKFDYADFLKSLKDRVQVQNLIVTDEELAQAKQEWKQENIGNLTDFENAMMHIGRSFFGENAGLDPNDTNAIKEQANLLMELIPKQEWSEEDDGVLLESISILQNNSHWVLADKLKLLKDRYTWKPSDEQMTALKGVQEGIFRLGILESLYQDLKKLKEKLK